MKTTLRTTIALGVALVTTATASAHCKTRYPMYPMYPMPMMPMMGFGVMPFAPVGVPAFGVGAGSSFQMSMSMSGDASMAVMLPLLLQALGRGFTVAGGVVGDPELRALFSRLGGALTEDRVRQIMREEMSNPAVVKAIKAIIDELEGTRRKGTSSMRSTSPSVSPELRKAQEEVQRLAAEIEARQKAWGTPTGVAKKADPQAEVQRLLAEIQAKQAGWKAPAATTHVTVSKK